MRSSQNLDKFVELKELPNDRIWDVKKRVEPVLTLNFWSHQLDKQRSFPEVGCWKEEGNQEFYLGPLSLKYQ